jgi:hypothetical protein
MKNIGVQSSNPIVQSYATFAEKAQAQDPEPISAHDAEWNHLGSILLQPSQLSGQPGKDMVGKYLDAVNELIEKKINFGVIMHQTFPNQTSGYKDVPLSPGMRDCSLHTLWLMPESGHDIAETVQGWAEYSYFSESSGLLTNEQFPKRYWADHYDDLVKIKQAWDPEQVFWCPRCVASTEKPQCPANSNDCVMKNADHQFDSAMSYSTLPFLILLFSFLL